MDWAEPSYSTVPTASSNAPKEVTVDDNISILHTNENIFIPQGSIHRLSNKTSNNLIIIEMWYGEKLDENDIERYEDIYNRK